MRAANPAVLYLKSRPRKSARPTESSPHPAACTVHSYGAVPTQPGTKNRSGLVSAERWLSDIPLSLRTGTRGVRKRLLLPSSGSTRSLGDGARKAWPSHLPATAGSLPQRLQGRVLLPPWVLRNRNQAPRDTTEERHLLFSAIQATSCCFEDHQPK